MIESMDTVNGLSSFLTKACLCEHHTEVAIVDMVNRFTANHGYSKQQCTFFPRSALFTVTLNKSYNIGVEPMIYPGHLLSPRSKGSKLSLELDR